VIFELRNAQEKRRGENLKRKVQINWGGAEKEIEGLISG